MIVTTTKTLRKTNAKPPADRYLIYDISLTSPGFAAIDVNNRKPTLVAVSHVKTDASQPDGQRFAIVEAFAITTASKHGNSNAIVVREDYKNAASKRQGQTIYGAWAAVDSGLQRCGLRVNAEINASTVKKTIGGHGKADKAEVAAGVRRILGLSDDFIFATDDESDAVAIGLTYLIEKGLIDV